MCRGNRRAWMCIGALRCGGTVHQSALAQVVQGGRASACADAHVGRRGASVRVHLVVVLLVPNVPER